MNIKKKPEDDKYRVRHMPYITGAGSLSSGGGGSVGGGGTDLTVEDDEQNTSVPTVATLQFEADTFAVSTPGSTIAKVSLSGVILADGSVPFTGDQSFGGNSITNLADPLSNQEGATKFYVDNAIQQARDFKDSVRVATVVAGTLATSFENGDTVDGVVLATGDRILIKDQAAGATNGIYIVAASGAPTRSTDADTSLEVTPGMIVPVEEGTANADKLFMLTTTGPITLNTTALTFSPYGVAGAPAGAAGGVLDGTYPNPGLAAGVAGAGLTETSDVLSVNVDNVTIEITTDTLNVKAGGIGPTQLASTTVVAGSYTATNLTVDADGRITAAANGSATSTPTGPAGGVLDGTYPNPGLAASVAGDGLTETTNVLSVNVDNVTIELTADTLNVKAGGIGPTQLASTAVTPGAYTAANITVDADGRITAAANGTLGGAAGGVLDGTYPNPGLAASVAGDALTESSNVLNVNVDNSTIEISGDALRVKDSGITVAKLANAAKELTIPFIIDGGGAVITAGIKGDVPVDFSCTILSATLLADQTGSIVVDIWKDTYAQYPPDNADSITASAPPTISTALKSQDTTLTGWTTTITAGDILRFNVDSASTVTRVTIALKVRRT